MHTDRTSGHGTKHRNLVTFAGCIAALAYGAAGTTMVQHSEGLLDDVPIALQFVTFFIPALIMLPVVVFLGLIRTRPPRALLYLGMGIIGQYVTPTNNVEIETSLILLVWMGSPSLAVAYAGFLVVTSFKEWADRSRGGRNR
ncbi:MAG: hypothetical protein M1314_01440 [Firmicutes bacterium]|nr:hypothetical protein [Bacillota bacterium]